MKRITYFRDHEDEEILLLDFAGLNSLGVRQDLALNNIHSVGQAAIPKRSAPL
jgi:hypothetical protein